ncbi:MAG: ATP-binding protein [Thermodesulfobacteriota bacterium]
MKDQDRKKPVLLLRWTSIIVTSCLILLGKGRVADPQLSGIFVIGYILSNLFLTFLPKRWFSNSRFFYSLVLIDTAIVSLGMYLSEKMATDFYLVFFLIIIFASMSRNFKLLMAIGGAAALLYGVLLYSWGLLAPDKIGNNLLRIPFVFLMTAFYGYLVQTFTEEKREQLTISEDKYGGLFENANDGIIILKNHQFIIADLNRKAVQLTGYEKEELIGRGFIDLFGPREKEKALNFLEEVLKNGEARTDSFSLSSKSGTAMEVDLSIKRIDFGDEFFYQVIFRDLTERRKLEKRIRESKRHLEAIFDGIQNRLSIQAPDYQILRVNRAVIKKYQTTFQELIGRKCYEAYYERSSPCEKCPIAITIETKQPTSSIMKISADDTTLRTSSYPILDEKGNLASIIEYMEDITEEQRLQEQLIQSEKLAGVGVLASGVAHEINNPLSGVIGMTELAMEEENLPEIKGYLKDVLNCGIRIKEIVNGLRTYSRIAKQGEQGLVDINEVLEESLKMVRLATKTTSVEVVKNFQPAGKIAASVGEVQQILTNLITNAFQAMSEKGGTLTLSTRSYKDTVEIKVSDNGMGIPQKNLKKIFDPFFTTKKVGEGTGLGLNIVYRIVTKYEGTIEVESKEGVGTTFTIRFPIHKEA